MYTSIFSQAGRDCANRHLHALCSMVLGAEYSDPAINHGPNPSADVPGRHEQPRRPAQQPPGSSQRRPGIPREIVRICTPAPRAGFPCVSGSSLGAAGLVAVVVRDALGRLVMGLVHGCALGRCTLPPAPCCRGHADVGWHGLAQLERIQVCTHLPAAPLRTKFS